MHALPPGLQSGTGGAERKLPGLQSGTGGAGRKLPGLQFVKSRVTNGRG